MPAAFAPEGIEIVGACYRGQLKPWAHFLAGLCGSLGTARIEIVGAFYNGDLKSWAHFIAGLCLQPWPQKALKSWAHFAMKIDNRGHIL